jgi:hypothetical protein
MTKTTFIIIISVFVILFSCNNKNATKTSQKEKQIDTFKKSDPVPEKSQEKNEHQNLGKYTQITSKSKIEVISLNKVIDTTSRYYKLIKIKCQEWQLTKDDIKSILLNSREIDYHRIHNEYPCYYNAQIKIDGQLANGDINAGAFCTIRFRDTLIILDYYKSDYKKFFLSGSNPD